MGFLSVNIQISGREALLIGAGSVGLRKMEALLKAGASLRVVEPNPCDSVVDLCDKGRIRLERAFDEAFFDPCPIVFIAVDDEIQSAAIAASARSRGLFVNSADRPLESDFFLPAVVDQEPFRIAVSTDGASPALAAEVAAELRERYRGYGVLVELLGRLRQLVLKSDLDPAERRKVFIALAKQREQLVSLLENRSYQKARELIVGRLGKVKLPLDFPLP
ncbi:MAG: bifunctional precorrin-2 dehydrogenase/sirohydrochlorin ferrochelatase [Deltaproteobacteria bacterium]|nr:bifunctional precorrin-2 dehydrogenase/sirohydrochlorin ferrochelatase [Deltaproteobacteria bacterium]